LEFWFYGGLGIWGFWDFNCYNLVFLLFSLAEYPNFGQFGITALVGIWRSLLKLWDVLDNSNWKIPIKFGRPSSHGTVFQLSFPSQ
jgi:hypothetical protein